MDEERFAVIVWPCLKEMMMLPLVKQSLDSFYLLLVVRSLFPAIVSSKFLQKHIGAGEIITEATASTLGDILSVSCNFVYTVLIF